MLQRTRYWQAYGATFQCNPFHENDDNGASCLGQLQILNRALVGR
jgi:hypothetical protein